MVQLLHQLAGLAPFAALAALIAAARARTADSTLATLGAVLTWASLLAATTELLSLARSLTAGPIGALWFVVTAAACVARVRRTSAAGRPPTVARARPPLRVSASIAGIGFILAGTLLVAFLAAPNSWDSMTYHLSRVEHWVQNHTVAHYPTAINRQLYSMPYAEMVVLHGRMLGGGDRLANLPAWLAFGGVVWLAARLGERFGASQAAGVSAAVFAATLPMAVIQASSTLNDLATGFFLLAVATLTFSNQRLLPRGMHCGLVGAALGLALLTKGTAYLYGAPLGIVFAVLTICQTGRRAVAPLFAAGIVVAALNAGHWWRNASVFGSPLVAGETTVPSGVLGPRSFASNVLRVVALDLATPSRRANALIVRGVAAAHKAIGISPSLPETTFAGARFGLSASVFYEGQAPYPLHLLLAVAAMIVVAARARREREWPVVQYIGVVVVGVVLFTALLRWQPWITRLQLPGFLLAAPIVGAALARWPSMVRAALQGGLLVIGLLALLANETRPLLPAAVRATLGLDWGRGAPPADPVWRADRMTQLFAAEPKLAQPYRRTAAWLAAQSAGRVGLVTGNNSWEYPLWVLLRDTGHARPEIRHVCVEGRSARPSAWQPEYLVTIDREAPDTLRCEGATWVRTLRSPPLAGYRRENLPPRFR